MKGVKGLTILGAVLLGVGIIGVLFTYSSEQEAIFKEDYIQNEKMNAIDIDTENAKVEVIPTDDSKAKVELSGSKRKEDKLHYKLDVIDGTLLIDLKGKHQKLYNFDFGTTMLTLKVYIPKKEYTTVKVKNGNGKITMEQLHAKEIDAISSNGHLDLKNIKGSELTLEVDNGYIYGEYLQTRDIAAKSNNGRIELLQVKAITVTAETDNGKIHLEEVAGDVKGKTNNGTISLVTDDLERPIELQTDNGIINVETKKAPENVEFDVHVDNGIVDILGQYKGNTVVGNGDNVIKLTTNNGKIKVKQI